MDDARPRRSLCTSTSTTAYGRMVASAEGWPAAEGHFWPHAPGVDIPEGTPCDCGQRLYRRPPPPVEPKSR